MLIRYNLFYVIAFSFLIGCNEKNYEKRIPIDDKNFINQVYVGNKLVSEYIITIDSNGEEIRNGYYKEFYNDGKKKSLFQYKNGLRHGEGTMYFENGAISGQYLWVEGKQLGKQVEYHSNGKVRNLILSDGSDSSLFEMQVNEKGGIQFMAGVPLHLHAQQRVYRISIDTLILYNEVIVTKDFTSRLNVRLIDPQGKDVFNKVVTRFESHGINDYYYFITNFKSVGNYIYEAEIDLVDEKGILILKRQVSDTIKVVL